MIDYGQNWRDTAPNLQPGHYALVSDGVVISSAPDPSLFGDYTGASLISDSQPIPVGHHWDGQTLTPPPVTVADIKREARRRILSRYPEWRQRNMATREARYLRIQQGLVPAAGGGYEPSRALTAEEAADEQAITEAWAWIDAVRAASDAIEAEPPASLDALTSDTRWPA